MKLSFHQSVQSSAAMMLQDEKGELIKHVTNLKQQVRRSGSVNKYVEQ